MAARRSNTEGLSCFLGNRVYELLPEWVGLLVVVINDVIIILKAHDRMFLQILAGNGRPSSAECGEADGRE